jgi:hypothetical protein
MDIPGALKPRDSMTPSQDILHQFKNETLEIFNPKHNNDLVL